MVPKKGRLSCRRRVLETHDSVAASVNFSIYIQIIYVCVCVGVSIYIYIYMCQQKKNLVRTNLWPEVNNSYNKIEKLLARETSLIDGSYNSSKKT